MGLLSWVRDWFFEINFKKILSFACCILSIVIRMKILFYKCVKNEILTKVQI